MKNATKESVKRQKRILIMAGGTGGHVFPALAVAEALQKLGWTIEWLGTRRGLELEIVPKAGFHLHTISITGIRREGILNLILAPLRLFVAMLQIIYILYRFKPSVVLGMGGFASGPGGMAAWLLRIPLIIHEQNAIAGTTNRLLTKVATCTLEGFPGSFLKPIKTMKSGKTIKPIKPIKAIWTGNPVREELQTIPEPEERFKERNGPLNILVLGGSQGAKALNEICPQAFALIPLEHRPFVQHQTGQATLAKTEAAYKEAKVVAMVKPFIQDMAKAYAWADLVICRAGALTVAELAMVGVGSILVPFPYAVDDHQTYNALFLEKGAAAEVISQTVLDPQKLADNIVSLSLNRLKILEMAKAAKALSQPEALNQVVKYCVQIGETNHASKM